MSSLNIKTAPGITFHGTGWVDKRQYLFSVSPNIPALDALGSASCLLSTALDPIRSAASGGEALEGNAAWLTAHALESVQAVIESLIAALESAEDAADQPATE